LDVGYNVVEAFPGRGEAAQTVKAEATLAGVDGPAERAGLQEIRVLKIDGPPRGFDLQRRGDGIARARGVGAGSRFRAWLPQKAGANLLWQAHLDEMAGLAAFEQAQHA
jgi:hypothetical protein